MELRRSLLPALLAGAVLLSAPQNAHADPAVGLDLDGAFATTPNSLVSKGGGFGVRLGSQKRFPLVRLSGELAYGYMRLSADRAPSDWTTHRVEGGARLGVGELLVPFAFAHVGYGWRNTSDGSFGGDGVAFDAGAGLDVNLGFIAFGGHVGYALVDAGPAHPEWVIVGLDGTLVF
jgi:hypothetical protein